MAVTTWNPQITVGTRKLAVDKIAENTPTVTGSVTITCDNGSEIGDVRTGSATFTVDQYGSATPFVIRRGDPVEITTTIAGSTIVRLYSGFVSESTVSASTHQRFGAGVRTQVTCVDMAEIVKNYTIDIKSKWPDDPGALEPAKPTAQSFYFDIVDLLRKRVPLIKRENSNLNGMSSALVAGMEFLNWDGKKYSAEATLGDGNVYYNLSSVVDRDKTYSVKDALSAAAGSLFGRAFLQGPVMGAKLARLNGGATFEIPNGCITTSSNVSSRLSDYWSTLRLKVRTDADNKDKTRTFGWVYGADIAALGEVVRDLDFTDFMADSAAYGRREWTESSAYHIAKAPRWQWRPSELQVLLNRWEEIGGPQNVAAFVKSVFDVDNSSPCLPSVLISAGSSKLLRLQGSSLNGIVEKATLTINPLRTPGGRRAEMKIELGPGDMASRPASISYRSPRWNEITYRWHEAGAIPFSREFIQN